MEFLIIALLIVNIAILIMVLMKVNSKGTNNGATFNRELESNIKNEITSRGADSVIKISKELSTTTENLVEKFNKLEATVNKDMGKNNKKLIEKFGELQNTISSNFGSNNEKVITKFGEL